MINDTGKMYQVFSQLLWILSVLAVITFPFNITGGDYEILFRVILIIIIIRIELKD